MIDPDKALQRIERSSTEEESLERIRQQGARGLTDWNCWQRSSTTVAETSARRSWRHIYCVSARVWRESSAPPTFTPGSIARQHRQCGPFGVSRAGSTNCQGRSSGAPADEQSGCGGALSRSAFRCPGQEIMGALFLDTRNRLLGEQEVYRGTLNRAAVEPRAVLKEALLRDAAGFVLFHTHPSGDPSPSAEDLAFTRRIAQSGNSWESGWWTT